MVWLPLVSRTEPAQRAEYIRQKTANEKEASYEIRKNQTHLCRSPRDTFDMMTSEKQNKDKNESQGGS